MHMRTVKRSVAIIRPKSPFIKWVDALSGDFGYASDYDTVFLIPSLLSMEALPIDTMGWRYINSAWDDIFKEMLSMVEEKEWFWPQYRTRKVFGQWFKVEFHSSVIDAVSKE